MRRFVSVVAAIALPVSAHAATLSVHLRCRDACAAEASVEVVGDRLSGQAAHAQTTAVLRDAAAVVLPARAEPGQIWRVTVQAADRWASAKILTIGPGDNAVSLDLYRSSALSADVVMAEKETPPRSLTAAFRSDAMSGETECPLVSKRWRCSLPAGVWDLRIKARGFISTHLWGVVLPAGGTMEAGSVVLRRGASITGFVASPRGAGGAAAIVSARPQRNGIPYAGSERVDDAAPTARPDSRGFFQIDGLAPGDYLVAARSRSLSSDVVRVRVLEGAEAELTRPLQLKQPESLMLFVDPATAPDGQRWRVSIRRADDQAGAPFETVLDVTGAIHLPRVVLGTYRIALATSAGQWYSETIEVAPGTLPVQIHLPLLPLRGTLRIGESPLTGTITFGGEHGAVRVAMRSDAAGDFHGFLPRDGAWVGEVTSEEQGVHSAVFETNVRRLDGAESAIVDIALPRTTVSGIVLLNGKPVETALVTINSAGSIAQQNTDREGHFRFNAAGAGATDIRAEWHGEYLSRPVSRTIVDGSELRDVVLDLEAADSIDGVVVSTGGPVPGAVLYAYSSSDPDPKIAATVCSIDGRFHERLSPGTREANIYVTVSGFSFRALRAPVNGEAVTINVQQNGGSLTLDFSRPPFADPVIFAGAIPVSYGILRMWSSANGGAPGGGQHVTLVNLEPGRYTVCMPADRQSALGLWSGRRTAQCVSGTLHASSELRLAIPVEAAAKASDTQMR